MRTIESNREVARVFVPLLQRSRFKAAYGGRGGAKSWFFADNAIDRALEGKRGVCIREVQNTLAESCKQLLEDRIAARNLGDYFDIKNEYIKSSTGGRIIFKGMRDYNAANIKSLEGFDWAWVEEAQTLSQRSLDMLIPTIRKEGSEIWFSWNPDDEEDPVDAFFRLNPPDNAIIVPVGWQDNPWFPKVLHDEMTRAYEVDEEKADWVWGGGYNIVTEASYYAKLLAKAKLEGRIGAFPYDPALPVITAWDIGVDDYTAIWFFQQNGQKVRAIDYYEASGIGAPQIIKEALPEILPPFNPDTKEPIDKPFWIAECGRPAPYRYDQHHLPHDVKVREWGAGAKTRSQTLLDWNVTPVMVGAQQGPQERINASRRLIPITYFNDTPNVRIGLKRLRKYSRRENRNLGTYVGILHDENSHGADALGEFAVNCGIFQVQQNSQQQARSDYSSGAEEEGESWRT